VEREDDEEQSKEGPLSKREIVKGLGFDLEEDWRSWLQSDLFKPHWSELWDDFMKKRCGTKRGLHGPPARLEAIQASIRGEVIPVGPLRLGKHDYSLPREQLDKSHWMSYGHYARFIYIVVHDNQVNPNGVFYNKKDSTPDDPFLIWNLMKYLQGIHRPWNINKSSAGGNAVMGNVPPKKQKPAKETAEKAEADEEDENGD
jgi:hypothetical protein